MSKRTINSIIRSLHRDIGFFVIGLTIIYAVSGIVLIYRGTGFLKFEKHIEKQLDPNLDDNELGRALHMRHFKVENTENNIVYFQNGTYNKASGLAAYTETRLPEFLDKFNSLHKKGSRSISHIFSTIFGVLLLFLAISSFWMFKARSKMFRRGIILAGAGIVFSLVVLFV